MEDVDDDFFVAVDVDFLGLVVSLEFVSSA